MLIDQSEIGYLAMETTVLVNAFEGALIQLGLPDRSHPKALVVAKLIINFAKSGERDAKRLRDLAVTTIRRIGQTAVLHDYHSLRFM